MAKSKKTTRGGRTSGTARTLRVADADSQMRQVWLAGLGAIASTGEMATDWLDVLIARGRKREPEVFAAAERSARDARRAVEKLATDAGQRSVEWLNGAIERLGVKSRPRSRNLLHRLGDVAEAFL